MRVRKLKYAKKILTYYKSYFGLNSPYRIVIDGTFCKAALDFKINIEEQLAAYLDDKAEIYTTSCAKKECEFFGAILSGPLQLLRRFPEYDCQHEPTISAVNCLLSLTRQRNKECLILASQDPGLLEKARERIGLPLIVLSHGSVHLERPSIRTRRAATRELDRKLHSSDYQHASLQALKKSVLGEEETVMKKRKRKGQNPLSCKPKKLVGVTRNGDSKHRTMGRKRKRRYRNVAPHIRGPLKELVQRLRCEGNI